jgi:hypothetical protein
MDTKATAKSASSKKMGTAGDAESRKRQKPSESPPDSQVRDINSISTVARQSKSAGKTPGDSVTAESLFSHPDRNIRQGALKSYLGSLVKRTKLTSQDVKQVCKELLPPPPVRVITAPTPKPLAGKKVDKQPVRAKPSAKKAAIAAIRNDTDLYPVDQRGPDSAYAKKIREVRDSK